MPQRAHDYLSESLEAFRRVAAPGADRNLPDRVLWMWFGLLAGVIFPPLALIGAWTGYQIRDQARGLEAGRSVERGLRVFWNWAIAMGVGFLTLIIFIGFVIMFAAQAYLLFSALRGVRRTLDGGA